MSDALNRVYEVVDEQNGDHSALSRRKLVSSAAATVGGLGLLGIPDLAMAKKKRHHGVNTPQNILAVAATAEVLATIVNTVGSVGGPGESSHRGPVDLGDAVTLRNVKAAAREELIHYNTLVSKGFGGKPVTKRIWVPDAVFASRTNLLQTLEVGDQIFVNAYLIGTTAFGNAGNGKLARIAAEFMGVEAVHRALARQSLGKLGNDRIFMRYSQRERADGPARGQHGFTKITTAVQQLQSAGFGFGKRGATPGQFYDFDKVKKNTPNDTSLNTSAPN